MKQTVELVAGKVYGSDDLWVTVYRLDGRVRRVTNKTEADRIRYIALIKYGDWSAQNSA